MDEQTAEATPDTESQTQETSGNHGEERGDEIAIERPEGLPDKFWNEEKSIPDYEGMTKAYSELEKKQSLSQERIREQVIEELNEEYKSSLPASPEDYDYKPPEGMEDLEVNNEDPLLNWFKGFAHEHGLPEESFRDGVNAFIEYQSSMIPDPAREMAELGENGEARVEAVDMWARANLPERMYNNIMESIPFTAKSMEILEEIIAQTQPQSMPLARETAANVNPTMEDVRREMDKPEYWDPGKRDLGHVRRVEEMNRRVRST